MRNKVVAVALLAAAAWVSAPGAAFADPARVAVFPFPSGAKLGADELSMLTDLVTQGMSELAVADYTVETSTPPEGVCDSQCLLESAKRDGAAYAVVGELKKLKGGTVMTVTLFAAADGQVMLSSVSELCPDLNGLMAAARTAAGAAKGKLASLIPAPLPEPEPAAPPPESAAPQPPTEPLPGTLRITSDPPGAQILIGGSKRKPGQLAGSTPVDLSLKAWSYWVTLTRPGYLDHREKVDIAVGQTLELKVPLEVDRWPVRRVAAHATLWPGVAFVLLAGTSGYMGWHYGSRYGEELDGGTADSSRLWTTIMWASGGLGLGLVATSIVFFVMWKKEPKLTARARDTMFGAAPMPGGGGVLAFQRRF